MARLRRNAPASDCLLPSCDYAESVGTLTLAAGASGSMTIEPQFSKHQLAQYIVATVFTTADTTVNARAVVNGVFINACNQLNYSSAGAAGAGIVVPDEWQVTDICLGMPVCWGVFGKTSQNEELRIDFSNLDAAAIRIQVTVRGAALDGLPAGCRIGEPLGGQHAVP